MSGASSVTLPLQEKNNNNKGRVCASCKVSAVTGLSRLFFPLPFLSHPALALRVFHDYFKNVGDLSFRVICEESFI